MLMNNKKYMRCVFDVLDADGDGGIDADELKQCLQINDTQEIMHMINEIDANGDGKIDFEEFVAAMTEKVAEGKSHTLGPNASYNPNAQITIVAEEPKYEQFLENLRNSGFFQNEAGETLTGTE